MKYHLTRNSATCLKCGDEIQSKHRHDYVSCKCGAIAVDGGLDYTRRVGDLSACEDTSLYKEYTVQEYQGYLQNASEYLSDKEKQELQDRISQLT